MKRNLPFPIYPADLGDRGFAGTDNQQAGSVNEYTKSTELKDAPSLHQKESTVILPLATHEIAIAFFLLQDYLLITNYSLSLAERKPPLLTGTDSCTSFLEVYLHFLLRQQRSTTRAPNISKMIYRQVWGSANSCKTNVIRGVRKQSETYALITPVLPIASKKQQILSLGHSTDAANMGEGVCYAKKMVPSEWYQQNRHLKIQH